MAYKNIPGKTGWQFKDDPVNPGFKRSALHNKQTGGVRTTGLTQVYAETKKTTDPDGKNRGEISATFYNKEVKPASFFSSLPAVGGGGGVGTAADPDFANVSFLLSTSGGSTVTDASNNGYTVGQTTPNFSTDTPGAAFTDNSLQFTGFSSEIISTASNTITDIGFAGDFTIEFWLKTVGSATDFPIFRPSSVGSPRYSINVASSGISWDTDDDVTTGFTGTTNVVTNDWVFIAISRNLGTTSFWVDGSFEGSFSDSNVYVNDDFTLPGSGVANMNFLINNLRITEGQALYTGTGAYNVPTEAFPTTGPDPDFANVVGLYKTPSNGSISDVSGTLGPFIIGTGAVIDGTQTQFQPANINLSGGGYVEVQGTMSLLDFGDDPFTIETWIYRTAAGTVGDNGPPEYDSIVSASVFGSAGWGIFIRQDTNRLVYERGDNGALFEGDANAVISNNTWTHVAVSSEGVGGNLRLFVNGVLAGTLSAPSGQDTSPSLTRLGIGRYQADRRKRFIGHIEDVRLTKGVARYAATFTPPTAEFPSS